MKIGPVVRPWRRIEKKRTGQDSQKSHKVVILRVFGEKPPLYRLKPKFTCCVTSPTQSRVQSFNMKFSGVRILQGVKNGLLSFFNNFLNFDLENDLEIKNAELHPLTNFSSSYD